MHPETPVPLLSYKSPRTQVHSPHADLSSPDCVDSISKEGKAPMIFHRKLLAEFSVIPAKMFS